MNESVTLCAPMPSGAALPWLAGEMLATGLLTGVAAAALVVVPVRMASARGPSATRP